MKKLLSVLLVAVMVISTLSIAVAELPADGVYTGSGAGLNGAVKVEVTVADGKLTDVKVVEHSETPGISDPAIAQLPQAIVDAQSADVDVVAGATFTSNGIKEAVKAALGESEAEDAGIPFEQADILVLGAGMAGIVTATRAAQLGLNVLVLEANASVGGSAMVAGGTLLGAGTRMQAEAGIVDDPALCFADFVRLGGAGTFNEELGREFSAISGAAVDWLDDLGADFGDRVPYFGVYQPLNLARNYSGNGGAKAFIAALTAELDNYIGKNAYISLNTRVTGLLTDETGAVIGAKAVLADGTEAEFKAPATVVATGGYGGNKELLTTYNFTNVLTTSPACVTGDGYFWLQDLNAALTNMDFCTSYAGGIETNPDNFRDFAYFNTQTGALWI
ncbi:MAG: FAD-binding protein, partial [Clostridia bacterium]|nr:FAD-binding protein [Clostridia bacterium]